MRIGIDGRWISRPVGLGTLSRNLIESLAKIDKKNQYVIYLRTGDDRSFIPKQANFETRLVKRAPYPVAEQIVLPRLISKDRLDLFHATLGTAPLNLSVPLVVTIADAMFAMPGNLVPARKSTYQRLGGWYRRVVTPKIYHKARTVVTISETAKKDLQQYLGRRDVQVAYLAASDDFTPGEISRDTARKFNLPKSYSFALVGTDPRKNSSWLVRAYLKSDLEAPLVLVGSLDKKTEALVRSLGSVNRIIFLGRVGHSELIDLYRGTEAFIFPSLYEAFGLPILEAMACGTPVVTLDKGSNKEIAGRAGVITTPSNLMKDIAEIEKSPALRKKLSDLGIERAKEFNWEKLAQQYLTIYKKVAE